MKYLRIYGVLVCLIVLFGQYAYGAESIDSVLFARELVQRIVLNKDSIKPQKRFSCFEKYEKYNAGFIGLTEKEERKFLLKYFQTIAENRDTSILTGQQVHYVLTKERVESVAQENHTPSYRYSYVLGAKEDWVDLLSDKDGIQMVVDEVLTEVNLMDQSFYLFLGQGLVGPFSRKKTFNYYDFKYIGEADSVNNLRCVQIEFGPKEHGFHLFKGRFTTTVENVPHIVRIDMRTAGNQNINVVNDIQIRQEFSFGDGYHLLESSVWANLALLKTFVQRTNNYYNYSETDTLPKLFNLGVLTSYDRNATTRSEHFWKTYSKDNLSPQEERVRQEMVRLSGLEDKHTNKKAWFVYLYDLILFGRINFKKFEITDIHSLYSYNEVEGSRFRIGGITTSKFSPHFFFNAYYAYGLLDKKHKLNFEAMYSFRKQDYTVFGFPYHYIKGKLFADYRVPGQSSDFTRDFSLSSFRQAPMDRLLFVREAELSYHREHASGLKYSLGLNTRSEAAAGNWTLLKFDPVNILELIESSRFGDIQLMVKYAPFEKFIQSKEHRYFMHRFNPSVTISHKIGVKGFLLSDHSYNRTDILFDNTFKHPIWGDLSTSFHLAKVWDNAPMNVLIFPQTNTSYFGGKGSFRLMNVMEFVYDNYFSFDIEHHFNGFFLNFIPANRWLALREVVGIRGIIGSLSDKNRPGKYGNKYLFPIGLTNELLTYVPGDTPYLEANVGLENLFRFLRVDWVWRLTYRNNPHALLQGIRINATLRF